MLSEKGPILIQVRVPKYHLRTSLRRWPRCPRSGSFLWCCAGCLCLDLCPTAQKLRLSCPLLYPCAQQGACHEGSTQSTEKAGGIPKITPTLDLGELWRSWSPHQVRDANVALEFQSNPLNSATLTHNASLNKYPLTEHQLKQDAQFLVWI